MEAEKGLSFNIVLLVVGGAFLLLGLMDEISAGSYRIAVSSPVLKVGLVVLGAGFAGLGIWNELKLRMPAARRGNGPSPAKSGPGSVTAQEFFYTLDDAPSKGFPTMVESATRVSILGRTAVNLLGQYQRVFEDLAQRGCEIRLLFVDPNSAASAFLYGSSPEVYKNNSITALAHVGRMLQPARNQLRIRVMDGAPTVSIVMVEKNDPQSSFLQVQLYFLHGAVGRDRPIFRVSKGDKWYGVFHEEFERLWAGSKEWEPFKLLKEAKPMVSQP